MQQNRQPEINSHIYGQLINDQGDKSIQGRASYQRGRLRGWKLEKGIGRINSDGRDFAWGCEHTIEYTGDV